MAKSATPSLSDIAKAAGVSLTTASTVLNHGKQYDRISPARRQQVMGVAQKMGYIPNYHARSMKLGRAEMIAVAIELGFVDGEQGGVRSSVLSVPYFSSIISGVELTTHNLGYQMTIVGPDSTTRAPERGVVGIRQRRFDGLIVPGPLIIPEWGSRIAEVAPELPVVLIEYAGQTRLPVIDFGEQRGLELAVRHLRELGHREVLWVGPREGPNIPTPTRQERCVQILRGAGMGAQVLEVEPSRDSDQGLYAQRELAATRLALLQLLNDQKRTWTAVLCFNDLRALAVMQGLAAAGLSVPRDVSVVGFDDIEAVYSDPPLTTISHRLTEMGQRATNLVMQMVNDPAAIGSLRGRREVVQAELIVRTSTGRA